jgi:serine/threonine-protein kinase
MRGGPIAGGERLFAKGKRIDRYEIREAIGQGGMGAVYRAFDTKLGRTVALKTAVAGGRTPLPDELRQRFMHEALAASKVEHRNVVQVLDFGFTDEGAPFLVMEYLRGQDLRARLKQSAQPLAVEYVVDVMLGVCAALRACHQAGIIHRDLKPANIFLVDTDTGPEVKVLDFGVSKAPLVGDLTGDGQIVGTPQYLSPEQVDGKTVPESDQYALGMLLYVCLTRRLPYQDHHNLSLLRAIELGEFQPPRAHRPDLPPELEAIILQALRLSPDERFASIHALGQQLWPFASARGREQWRTFYLEPPPIARPAKESTLGIAILEELARGAIQLPPAAGASPAAPTDTLQSAADGGSIAALPSAAPGPGSQAYISTKLALPETSDGAEARPGAAGGRPLRRVIAGLLGGAGLVAGALVVYSGVARERYSPHAPPAARAPASATAPAPTPPAPPDPPQETPPAAVIADRAKVSTSPAAPPASAITADRQRRHASQASARPVRAPGRIPPDGIPIVP